MSIITEYDSLLLDLDGTVYEGGAPIAHAVEAITSANLPAMYVTNNASRAPEVVAAQLREIGLDSATESVVLTSAQAAVSMAAEKIPAGSSVYVVGTESFRDLAHNAGFVVVDSADDKPAAVLHGHNPETSWYQLSEAALSIQAGALYFASNLDTTLPMERGLHVGNGSMVAAVVSATGVTPDSAGKPGPAMFHQAQAHLNTDRPLVVGDRLNTDIAGGIAAGMDTFQVLTGVSGHYALLTAIPEERPTFVADSLLDLTKTAEALRPGPQGGFTAHVEGEEVVLDGGEASATPTQALRTALHAAWAVDEAALAVTRIRTVSEAATKAVESWW